MAVVLTNITKIDNLFTKNFSMPKENLIYRQEKMANLVNKYKLYTNGKTNFSYEV